MLMNDHKDGLMTVPATEIVSDLRRINDQLTELHKRVVGTATDWITPIVRALLFNLIVYARSEDEAEEAAVNISEIIALHPCRAIIVDVANSEQSSAVKYSKGQRGCEGIITAVCGITSRGERTLCGEIITLRLTPRADQVIGSVTPVLLGDAPVVLWIPGDIPQADPDFESLFLMADHVLLDSRRFTDLPAGLSLIPRFCPHESVKCTSGDLSWASIQKWRELIAQHFDPPSTRHYLAKLQRVDVTFADSPGIRSHSKAEVLHEYPPSASLFLSCWFMLCTGLQLREVEHSDRGQFIIQAEQEGRPVNIRLSPTGQELPGGQIGAFVVRGGDSSDTATFIVKSKSMTEIVVTEECPGVCLPPQVLDIVPESDAALAASALDASWRDVIYEDVVKMAFQVVKKIRS